MNACLTPAEIARDRLQLSYAAVCRLCARGMWGAFMLCGRWQVPRAAFERWFQAQQRVSEGREQKIASKMGLWTPNFLILRSSGRIPTPTTPM